MKPTMITTATTAAATAPPITAPLTPPDLAGEDDCGAFPEVVDGDPVLVVDVGPPAVDDGELASMHEASLDEPMGTISDEPPERP